MKGFVLCDKGCVATEWIDSNGHMNVTAYMALFDKGTNVLLNRCGIGNCNGDLTMVATRLMIDHRRELIQGDNWELWSGVISAYPTYLTITHRLRSPKSLHAACDIRGVPFSKRSRGAVRFDNDDLMKLQQLIVLGLVDRFDTIAGYNKHK